MEGKNTIKNRMDRLEEIIRPKNSLAYKVNKLSERDRSLYENWRRSQDEWLADHPGERAYVVLLAYIRGDPNAEYPTELPKRIHNQLFISESDFSASDINSTAEQRYTNLLEALKK